MSKQKKLTIREGKFVKAKLEGKSGKDAAKAAGYSGNGKTMIEVASKIAKKPHIKEALQQAAEALGITPEYILKGFKNLKEFNETEISVPFGSGDSAIINKIMINPQVALKATESLAKTLDIISDKVEVEINDVTGKEEKLELAKQIALAFKELDQF